MSAAAIQRQIDELEAQLAGLRMALALVKGAEVSSAPAVPAAKPASGKVTVHKPNTHSTRRPVREDAAAAGTPGTEASEEDWANAVSAYIDSVKDRYPEGVPIANVTNPGLYKDGTFIAYPGIKGGVEKALINKRFKIVVKEETGGKLVKNRAA
jgi:hypothetical protein